MTHHLPPMQLPALAPSPETQRLHAAVGLYVNATREHTERGANLHLVVPSQRESEAAFLDRWGGDLATERHRIITWARDLQARQIATGQLIPQADGSFQVGQAPPPAPTEINWGLIAKAAGIIAALIALIALIATGAIFPIIGVMLFIGVPIAVVRWLFGGGKKTATRPAGDSSLIAARAEAQRAADMEAQAAIDRAREQEMEADRRRREALDRARQRAALSDDDGWD